MEVNFNADQTPVVDVESQVVPTPANDEKIDPSKITAGGTTYSDPSLIPATTGGAVDSGFIMGDSLPGFREIILPRINIVQGVGMLKDSFPQGAIVHGQNLVLFTPAVIDKATGNAKVAPLPPVNITILGFRPTRFVEKIAGGERGMMCSSEAEVRAAGGTLDFNEWNLKKASGMKRFEYLAEAFITIKRPEHVADDGTVFIYDIAGEKYALALWAMKGTAYTAAAKAVFFTARKMGCLQKGGYPSWNYSFTTRSKPYAGNTFYVPVCIPNAPSTPAFLDFARALLNPAPAAE